MARSTRNRILMHWKSALNNLKNCLDQICKAHTEAGDGQPIFNEHMPTVVSFHEEYRKLLERIYEHL